MKEGGGLTRQIADRIRGLRSARGLSLVGLSNESRVSRSMISLIERGESSPTAAVLEKLAAGLGVTLASLFEPAAGVAGSSDPLARRDDQPEWTDPGSGYKRRNVSPASWPQPLQIVEVRFPPGRRVTFDNSPRGVRLHQQVWVLAGAIDIRVGRELFHLREGDCLAMQLDRPTMFHNPSRRTARYAVVIATEAVRRR